VPDNVKPKLGLALSGGGFRATLFHLGVLHRLAEMDLLRKVDVISTVSGGSILGAAYYLQLRKMLETSDPDILDRMHYERVVQEVEKYIRSAIQSNLRTRMIWNPVKLFLTYVSGGSFSTRIRSLYDQFLYSKIGFGETARISPGAEHSDPERLDLRLQRVRVRNSSGEPLQQISEMNISSPSGTKIPKLVLNASCLNTGHAFRFSLSEVGGDEVGFIRFDEAKQVETLKTFLASVRRMEPVEAVQAQQSAMEMSARVAAATGRQSLAAAAPARATKAGLPDVMPYIIWWAAASKAWNNFRTSQNDAECAKQFREYLSSAAEKYLGVILESNPSKSLTDDLRRPLNKVTGSWTFAKAIAGAEDNKLRRAKIAAYYLVVFDKSLSASPGGCTQDEHASRFWEAIHEIVGKLPEFADPNLRFLYYSASDQLAAEELFRFIYHAYLARNADRFSWFVARALDRLTLTDAVVASANFPPLFAPFELHDIYDPEYIASLALTDGGIYDNQGVDALLSDEDCTHIIVSDASRVLEHSKQVPSERSRMLNRIMSVLMDRVRYMQLGEVRRTLWSTMQRPDLSLRRAAFFHIGQDSSRARSALKGHRDALAIAALRTDLDSFNEIEMNALIYQGYQLCDRFVREYLGNELGPFGIRLLEDAVQNQVGDKNSVHTSRILGVGKYRLFRTIAVIFGKATWIKVSVGAATVTLLLAWFRNDLFSFFGAAVRFVAWLLRHSPAPYLWDWSKHSRLGLPTIAIGLAVYIGWPRLYAATRAFVSSTGGRLNKARAKLLQREAIGAIEPTSQPAGKSAGDERDATRKWAKWKLTLVRTTQEGSLHWWALSLIRSMRKWPRFVWFMVFGFIPLIVMLALSLFGCLLALDTWLLNMYACSDHLIARNPNH